MDKTYGKAFFGVLLLQQALLYARVKLAQVTVDGNVTIRVRYVERIAITRTVHVYSGNKAIGSGKDSVAFFLIGSEIESGVKVCSAGFAKIAHDGGRCNIYHRSKILLLGPLLRCRQHLGHTLSGCAPAAAPGAGCRRSCCRSPSTGVVKCRCVYSSTVTNDDVQRLFFVEGVNDFYHLLRVVCVSSKRSRSAGFILCSGFEH